MLFDKASKFAVDKQADISNRGALDGGGGGSPMVTVEKFRNFRVNIVGVGVLIIVLRALKLIIMGTWD